MLTPKETEAAPFPHFGDGSDGAATITSAVELASVEDGDVVVREYASLDIQSGGSLTVSNRCRGLVIFVRGDCNIDGSLTMTGKGCRANPADAATSTDTPVAPSDGNAVPDEGVVLRFPKTGGSDSHSAADIGDGLGTALREILQRFPAVTNGYVINIPRVGGAGAAARSTEGPGTAGGTLTDAPGGGGGGACTGGAATGAGSAGTCFSGGSASGGAYSAVAPAANGYGGPGGAGAGAAGAGGAGNPGGAASGSAGAGNAGTGGLLLLIARTITGSGAISSEGKAGGGSTNGMAGGSSGGGVVGIVYSAAYAFTGTISVAGGPSADGYITYDGGKGGDGSLIGPTQIDE